MKTTIGNFRIGHMGAAVTAEIITEVADKQPVRSPVTFWIGKAREMHVKGEDWRGYATECVSKAVEIHLAQVGSMEMQEGYASSTFLEKLKSLGIADMIERQKDGKKTEVTAATQADSSPNKPNS